MHALDLSPVGGAHPQTQPARHGEACGLTVPGAGLPCPEGSFPKLFSHDSPGYHTGRPDFSFLCSKIPVQYLSNTCPILGADQVQLDAVGALPVRQLPLRAATPPGGMGVAASCALLLSALRCCLRYVRCLRFLFALRSWLFCCGASSALCRFASKREWEALLPLLPLWRGCSCSDRCCRRRRQRCPAAAALPAM